MASKASGTFDVKLAPQAAVAGVGDPMVGRMAIAKHYHGDLDGAGKGEMLATRGEVDGSAGYVAIERVVGALHGRKGSFALQHSGTMNRGMPTMVVTVIPDSGTGELVGLTGAMAIVVDGGKHSYEFEYTLAEGL